LPHEPIDHGKANAKRSAPAIRHDSQSHQLVGGMFRRSSAAVATSIDFAAQLRQSLFF